jgi:broad specificity phosphatase PhoE
LAHVQHRAVTAIREHDRRFAQQHGRDCLWVACTHGDVIKSLLADAFGIHLDGFQRLMVEPASISVVRYTPTAPYVWRINDTGADLSALAVPAEQRSRERAGPVPGGEVDAEPQPAAAAAAEGGASPDADNGNADSSDSL